MQLPDVNVLVYAHREDTEDHSRYREWLVGLLESPRAYAISDLVLSGFLRVVTHPRIFREPSSRGAALRFVHQIRDRNHCVRVEPGPRHWDIFEDLLDAGDAKGNLIPDAYHAALAIEHGCEWISTDRDYARFPDLDWRHPLAG